MINKEPFVVRYSPWIAFILSIIGLVFFQQKILFAILCLVTLIAVIVKEVHLKQNKDNNP